MFPDKPINKDSVSPEIYKLIKSGHLERTICPDHLTKRRTGDGRAYAVEYLYRQTGRPYKRKPIPRTSSKNMHSNAQIRATQGHDLWRMYPTLPKWFRRMMMD